MQEKNTKHTPEGTLIDLNKRLNVLNSTLLIQGADILLTFTSLNGAYVSIAYNYIFKELFPSPERIVICDGKFPRYEEEFAASKFLKFLVRILFGCGLFLPSLSVAYTRQWSDIRSGITPVHRTTSTLVVRIRSISDFVV